MIETDEKEAIIIQYLPLVEKVVSRVQVKSLEYDRSDLVNIGVIGLMDAIDKYDDSKKVPFENYAYIRIKGSIIDEVRKTSRVSRSAMNKLKDYYQAKEELESRLNRTPTEAEILKHMRIGEKQLNEIYDIAHYLSSVSLESMVFTDESNGVELGETIEDRHALNSEEEVLKKEQQQLLLEGIRQLGEREQYLLNLYYVEELSLKEIAYILEVSIPRVSQIHGKTILKLRDWIRRNDLD